MDFGSFNWKTEICPIKNSPNGNVFIGEKFSPMKTFSFELFFKMRHISVFHVNDPKSMNFFYNFRIFGISCAVSLSMTISHLQIAVFLNSHPGVARNMLLEIITVCRYMSRLIHGCSSHYPCCYIITCYALFYIIV